MKTSRTAKFQVYVDAVGGYRFRLMAPNGKIIAQGESFTTRAKCMASIKAVRKYAATAVLVKA